MSRAGLRNLATRGARRWFRGSSFIFEFSSAPKACGVFLSTVADVSNWAKGAGTDCQRLKHRCVHDEQGIRVGPTPSPSVNIATNSEMCFKIEEDMDVNAGPIRDDKV